MTEQGEISTERLTSMVKTGAVENYSKKGYTTAGDEKAMDVIFRTRIDDSLGLSKSYPGPEGYTNMTLVPLSSSALVGKLDKSLNPQDVAICIAYYGIENDKFSRNGSFRSVVIMSEADGKQFLEAVKENPSLVYQLVRHVNSGPITKFDGSPADIKPGKAVDILPNSKVGGNISQASKSASFSEGFEPNSMF